MFIANKTDTNKKQEGVWAEFGGAEWLICSADRNTKYIKKIGDAKKKLEAAWKKKHKNKEFNFLEAVTEDETGEALSIMAQGLAGTILKGWSEDVKEVNEAGEVVPLEFSEEAAVQLLMDNPEVQEFITDYSQEIANYQRDGIEKIKGK